jgi:hypothetical protein
MSGSYSSFSPAAIFDPTTLGFGLDTGSSTAALNPQQIADRQALQDQQAAQAKAEADAKANAAAAAPAAATQPAPAAQAAATQPAAAAPAAQAAATQPAAAAPAAIPASLPFASFGSGDAPFMWPSDPTNATLPGDVLKNGQGQGPSYFKQQYGTSPELLDQVAPRANLAQTAPRATPPAQAPSILPQPAPAALPGTGAAMAANPDDPANFPAPTNKGYLTTPPAQPVGAPSQAAEAPPAPAGQTAANPTAVNPVAPTAPQAVAPLKTQATPKSEPDSYATATPAPGARNDVVTATAEKYGVPIQVANWVGTHESHWDTGATGIQTSSGQAKGAWQLMDGTAKQYGVTDPHDFAQSTDGAMHYLSDLAAKNGGDWTKAIQQYGTFSTGQGPEADARVKAGFEKYIGLTGTAPGDTGATGGTSTAPTPPGAAPNNAPRSQIWGMNPDDFNPDTMNLSRFSPSSSDKLFGLASGLLGAPTLGQGLSKGLANYGAIQAQDSSDQMKTYQELVKAKVDSNKANQMAMMYNLKGMPKQTGKFGTDSTGGAVEQVADPMTGATMWRHTNDGSPSSGEVTPTAVQTAANGTNRVSIGQQNADSNTRRSLYTTSGQGQVDKAAVPENLKDSEALMDDYTVAGNQRQQIADLRDKITNNPNLTGSSLMSRINKVVAGDLGMDISGFSNPGDAGLTKKIYANLNNTSVLAQSHGALSRMTQGEFTRLSDGYLNGTLDQKGALALLGSMDADASRRMAISQTFSDLPQEKRQEILHQPNGVSTWHQQQMQQQFADRGITEDGSKEVPSQYTTAPGGGPTHVPFVKPAPGSIVHFDLKGNLVK